MTNILKRYITNFLPENSPVKNFLPLGTGLIYGLGLAGYGAQNPSAIGTLAGTTMGILPALRFSSLIRNLKEDPLFYSAKNYTIAGTRKFTPYSGTAKLLALAGSPLATANAMNWIQSAATAGGGLLSAVEEMTNDYVNSDDNAFTDTVRRNLLNILGPTFDNLIVKGQQAFETSLHKPGATELINSVAQNAITTAVESVKPALNRGISDTADAAKVVLEEGIAPILGYMALGTILGNTLPRVVLPSQAPSEIDTAEGEKKRVVRNNVLSLTSGLGGLLGGLAGYKLYLKNLEENGA